MSTDQRDALEEAGVVQRHVVTKYRDGHVNVEDVTATHPADAMGAVRMNQPPTGEAVAWMTPGGDVSRSWLWCNERCPAGQNPTPLYTAHPADAPGAVRALVAKWRDAAEGSTDSPNPTIKAVARCHIELATELEAALAQAPTENAAAKHWHDLYRKECQLRQDDAARYGQQIVDLEAQAPAARVTDEMARQAEIVREQSLRKIASYGSAGVEERYNMAMRAALEAALGQGKANG